MTNQEAIKVIRALWAYQEPHYTEKEIREALDLAIKALETPQVVLFAENITEEEKQKLIAEFKAAMDNAVFTVEPERPKGYWIADTSHCYDDDEDTFECSVCKEPFTLICGTPKDNLYNFCPNCGADMRGENK